MKYIETCCERGLLLFQIPFYYTMFSGISGELPWTQEIKMQLLLGINLQFLQA